MNNNDSEAEEAPGSPTGGNPPATTFVLVQPGSAVHWVATAPAWTFQPVWVSQVPTGTVVDLTGDD